VETTAAVSSTTTTARSPPIQSQVMASPLVPQGCPGHTHELCQGDCRRGGVLPHKLHGDVMRALQTQGGQQDSYRGRGCRGVRVVRGGVKRSKKDMTRVHARKRVMVCACAWVCLPLNGPKCQLPGSPLMNKQSIK
jgi:hypothetical protein